jgi:chorismate mutase/prephenate dehydratase
MPAKQPKTPAARPVAANPASPAGAAKVAAKGPASLAGCRKKIDAVDEAIVRLLDARACLARRIGQIKRRQGREMFDAGRHVVKLNQAADKGSGDFPAEGLRLVFGEIQSACLSLEAEQKIAFLGPSGTFSHIAAMRVFGNSVSYLPYPSIPEIFQAVENEWVNYGIVPIENSTGGMIHATLDELVDSPLVICAEAHVPVHHHLLCKGKLSDIRKICTHPQILLQCRNWLRANLPDALQVEVASSSEGAAMARRDKSIASIGPELAAKLNHVCVRASRIEDKKDNVTRFLIIGHRSPAPTGHDKTSIMFSFKDETGALMGLLAPFSSRGINLSKIESRPSRKRAWDYIFFIDIDGHIADPKIQAALEEVKAHVTFLRVLGSYPIDAGACK